MQEWLYTPSKLFIYPKMMSGQLCDLKSVARHLEREVQEMVQIPIKRNCHTISDEFFSKLRESYGGMA